MPKISREEIQKDEKRILAEIQKNSNAGIDELAKQCGFSRQKVWRSLKRLEENHNIWGYTAVIDDEMMGQKHYLLLMKRKHNVYDNKIVDTLLSRRFDDEVSKQGINIESSSYIHGEYDWVTTFTATDIRHAKKFCELIHIFYPNVFEKITLMETLFHIKRHHILNPDAKKLKELL